MRQSRKLQENSNKLQEKKPCNLQLATCNSQRGNVFIIIMAGIFLFGALMFTFSKSGNKGSGNLTKQQAKIAAQEILSYANLVEGAVDRVRRNGCSENEISFENSVIASYTNPNAPVDKHCHIFEPEGGKISYLIPDEGWLDKNYEGTGSYGNFVFTGNVRIVDIGSANTEISIYLPFISNNVCESINTLINIENPLKQDTLSGVGFFQGSFTPASVPDLGDEAAELAGKSTSCFQRGTTYNMFFHTLLAR